MSKIPEGAPKELVATWLWAMLGTALEAGITEQQIIWTLRPEYLPELIDIARGGLDRGIGVDIDAVHKKFGPLGRRPNQE